MSGVGCDFCRVTVEPAWIYPCDDFTMDIIGTVEHVSTGAWLACESCSAFIEAGDWGALARQTIASPEIRERVARLHQGFNQHRRGERVRFG